MRESESLYRLDESVVVPAGLPLVAGLTGFTDAGAAVSQFGDYVVESLDSTIVAEFDADALLDYRARRPVMTFDQDHLTSVETPRLALHLAHDELGQPFLFLTGYEPDFRWDGFVRSILDLVDRFEVSSTTWVNAIPMPVPHTRPLSVTVSGTRKDLVESMSVWKPTTQAPANALHLLEYRLQERGAEVTGFVLLIPHYLADTEYPTAAVASLENVSAATGLIFPTDRLREQGREFVGKVEEQVEGNPELVKLVAALEARHDAYMEGNQVRSPLTDVDGEVPSADAIAAELEKFLAFRRTEDGDPRL